MTSWEREAAHWERFWYGGHADRTQVKRALQELGVDDSYIADLLGPEPAEVEEPVADEREEAA